jgi:hypothetical protein
MMKAAKKVANVETYLEAGRVDRVVDGLVEVRLDHVTYRGRRAKSCLVAPEVGDTVLCAVGEDQVFVIAVLEGHDGASTKLAVDGDLEVRSRAGHVKVSGAQGVGLLSSAEVDIVAASVNIRAPKGTFAIDELGFLGRLFQAQVTKVAIAAKEIDTLADRLSQRLKRAFRFVEGIDQTRAGTVDLRAQNLVGIRGENAVISARVLAKVDGEQIHIG